MNGDFSRWKPDELENFNFNGVLHQQGRVLTDEDWNSRTRIENDWQDQTGQDAIGALVAAVPAAVPGSFKVHAAKIDTIDSQDQVIVEIEAGRVWADGLLTYLDSTNGHVERMATYLEPPATDTLRTVSEINANTRDAVVLEVWRESMNGFQMPGQLLEPALGGPDSTERVHTAMALRLLRLNSTDRCPDVIEKLKEVPFLKGRLAVTLAPPVTTTGDCPTEQGGGYTGFEHHLFRIEIARLNPAVLSANGPMIKWSRFNGGLVGRGNFEAVKKKVQITANFAAITTCGLTKFYLEAVQYNELLGHWQVTYGAEATLNADNELYLSASTFFGTIPPAGTPVFFRLWDGIKTISSFVPVNPGDKPVELTDSDGNGEGILLQFDKGTAASYLPGDFWSFEVRAGNIGNEEILVGEDSGGAITGELPYDIQYHRVPLAILSWVKREIDITHIHDCRRIFRPLIDQEGCCTYTVGKGGDFTKIQDAINQLPDNGGQICILPGIYKENVSISGRHNIVIRGCDKRTVIMPDVNSVTTPTFTIKDSTEITLEHMDMETYGGIAVFMMGSKKNSLFKIKVSHNRILACINAVNVLNGHQVVIDNNIIRMLDKDGGDVAIFMHALSSKIEDNDITVVPAEDLKPEDTPGDETIPNPTDPCADYLLIYKYRPLLLKFIYSIWKYFLFAYPKALFKAPGGIQIAGGSDTIGIYRNRISGGYWNGITLGHLSKDIIKKIAEVAGKDALKKGIDKLNAEVLADLRKRFAPFVYNLEIEENDISKMGLNGIGTVTFFELRKVGLLLTVEDISIYRNTITQCLEQAPLELSEVLVQQMAFGGISLGDCENLVARENRIEDNGVSYPGPACGIFVQHGEKIDISDNRILNNGPRSVQENAATVKGFGGGVVIRWSFKRMVIDEIRDKNYFSPDGIPAVKIHDNIITQPLGQALFIMAMGSVSVVGNHLTSQGVGRVANAFSLLGGAVVIANLGISSDLFGFFLLSTIRRLFTMQSRYPESNFIKWTDYRKQPGVAGGAAVWGKVLELLLYLPDGNILFSNNQVHLDLRDQTASEAISSHCIFSLDDISYTGNQSLASGLLDPTQKDILKLFQDGLLTDALLLGATVRANDNRFQEGFVRTFFSLVSAGILMNACTSNQATHCLIASSVVRPKKHDNNSVLYPFILGSKVMDCKYLNACFEAFLLKEQTSCFKTDAGIPGINKVLEQIPKKSELVFDKTETMRVQGLEEIGQLNLVKRASMVREKLKLVEEHGNTYYRVEALEKKINYSKGMEADIDAVYAEAKMDVQPLSDEFWRVHGKVFDSKRKGIKDRTVSLYTGKGTRKTQLGYSCTDGKGYFTIDYDTAKADVKQVSSEEPLYLYVSDKDYKVLYCDKEPLFVKAGITEYRTIMLPGPDDDDQLPDCNPPEPGGGTVIVPEDQMIVKGWVSDEAGIAMAGVTVTLFDRANILAETLEPQITDKKGEFQFALDERTFKGFPDGPPAIYLRVTDKNRKNLYSLRKAIRYEAGRTEAFNITVKKPGKRGRKP